MVLEVNDAGEVLIPAELVQAAPHTQLEADRHGDALVLKPIVPAERPHILDHLPAIPGRFVDEGTTFQREDLYETDAR
jgi:hypothetical protein